LWYGWRYQISELASRFRVIAPDLRGFGRTDAPTNAKAYSFKTVCTDLVQLLDELNISRAVFIGHDWGGALVWRMCMHYPNRVIAVGSVCTPYTPRADQFIPLSEIVKKLPNFRYQVYFNDGDKAEKEFDSNPSKLFLCVYRGTKRTDRVAILDGTTFLPEVAPQRSEMISQKELDYYVQQYTRSGFRGGLNWYRTHRTNWEEETGISKVIHHPALMVTVGKDPILKPSMAANMEKFVPNLKRAHIEDANHWVQVDKANELNEILLRWLNSLNLMSRL